MRLKELDREEILQALKQIALSSPNDAVRLAHSFGYVRVCFPDIVGIPADFEQISRIILDIIPCHLDVEFYFRYLTWTECHAHQYTWSDIHQSQWNWYEFQCAI